MKKILYLPIEIKKRELLPKLFLGLRALDKGFNFVIGNKTSIFAATNFFGPGIYFYKSMNFNDTNHIKNIKKKNNIYIVHDEESGVTHSTSKTLNNFINIRSSEENLKLIDRFYTWGNFDHKAWIKKYPRYQNKFKMTGSPRLDLCIPRINKYFLSDEIKEIKKKYKKYILFISSGISSDVELKNIFKQDKFFFRYKNKIEKLNRVEQMKNLRKYFVNSINLINCISKNFNNINIVVRPHPNENLKDWRKEINQFNKNVILDSSDKDIASLIKNSECVIHNSSFSGIQTSLLNKPTIVFSPKKINLNKRSFPNKLGIKANSEKEVCQLIKKLIFFKNRFNKKKILNQTLSRVNFTTDKTASDKIINDFSKFKINKFYKDDLKINFYSRFLFLKNFLRKKINLKNQNRSGRYTRRTMSEKLGGGIFKDDISKYVRALRKKNKDLANVVVRSFGPNGFYISKK